MSHNQAKNSPAFPRGRKLRRVRRIDPAERAQIKQRRCANVTGVPDPRTYASFQKKVRAFGRFFMQLTLLGENRLPEGPFVLMPTHTSFLDIPTAGQIPRPMAWPCKPSFVPTDNLAHKNQGNGAIPFARKKDEVWKPKLYARMFIWCYELVLGKEYVPLRDRVLTRDEMMALVVGNALKHNPVVMFGQGERKRSARSDRSEWYLGPALAAIRADVPLVPEPIFGLSRDDRHRRTRFGLRRRAVAIILDPLYPGKYADILDEKARAIAMMIDAGEAIDRGLDRAEAMLFS